MQAFGELRAARAEAEREPAAGHCVRPDASIAMLAGLRPHTLSTPGAQLDPRRAGRDLGEQHARVEPQPSATVNAV